MRFVHFLIASLLLSLSGCSQLGTQEQLSGSGQASAWQLHKQQITPLDAWQINGKIGIRSEKESGSAVVFWLQRQDYFDIRLSGPLGQGSTRLIGRQGAVSLDIANRPSKHLQKNSCSNSLAGVSRLTPALVRLTSPL